MNQRKWIKHKRWTWFHRHNPFNSMLRNRLRNTERVLASSIQKTHFDASITDQGNTQDCFEYQSCQIENAIDGVSYNPISFVNDVCAYLRISSSEYQGTDMKTGAAALIDPGIPAKNGSRKKLSAFLWINPESGKDLYDTIQDYIVKYQRPVISGVDWYSEWDSEQNGIVPTDNPKQSIGGHCIGYYGNIKSGQMGSNFPESDRQDNAGTWGVSAPGSAKGHYFFARQTVNQYGAVYGCGIGIISSDKLTNLLGELSSRYIALIDIVTK